jgi:hypothetical protein
VLDRKIDNAVPALRTLPGVSRVEAMTAQGNHIGYRIAGSAEADLCPAIYQLATQQQWPVRELRSDRQTLESVFSRLAA